MLPIRIRSIGLEQTSIKQDALDSEAGAKRHVFGKCLCFHQLRTKKMFIDYVTLMLINMAGGLFILASFIWKDIDKENSQFWAPAFALPGMIAVVCGFAMTFSWPLPKPYNVAFGETSILLGFLFLTAAWSLAKGWELLPLGIYAFFAGLTGVLVGIRIMNLGCICLASYNPHG